MFKIIKYTVRAIVKSSLNFNNSVRFVYFVRTLFIPRPTLFWQSFEFVCMYVHMYIYVYIYVPLNSMYVHIHLTF